MKDDGTKRQSGTGSAAGEWGGWPNWLEARLMDGGPGAYETLAPELRAWLKSHIALLHQFWGEPAESETFCRAWLASRVCRVDTAADWALFMLDKNYASPAGLLAAVMPALLAGVTEVAVCLVTDDEEAEDAPALALPISAVLELAGLERIYFLSGSEASGLLHDLLTRKDGDPAAGRLLILSALGAQAARMAPAASSDASPADCRLPSWPGRLAWEAARNGLACAVLPADFTILAEPDGGVDLELLRWAHPEARVLVQGAENLSEPGAALAAVGGRRQMGKLCGLHHVSGASLAIESGNEAFWFWPGLEPGFFRRRRFSITNHQQG